MKRTEYFLDIRTGNAQGIKRITKEGKVEFCLRFPQPAGKAQWEPSFYDAAVIRDARNFKHITRDEARKIRPVGFRKVKSEKPAKPGLELANKIRKVLDGIDYKGSQKIRAIKAIRAASTNDWVLTLLPGQQSSLGDYICGNNPSFGLAEAKITVENFDKFLAFIEEHNEMPAIGWDFRQPFTKA